MLWRRKAIIALVTFALVASAWVATAFQEPLYAARVKVLLERRSTESLFDTTGEDESDPARRVSNEMEVIKSEPVRAAVHERLGSHRPVTVGQVGDTDVVEVGGVSGDPRRAGEIARAYALEYIELRRRQAVEDLTTAASKLEAKINSLQAQIDVLDGRVNEAAQQQARARGPDGFMPAEPLAGLTAQRAHLLTEQALLKQRLNDLQLDADLRTGGAELVTGTLVRTSKIGPHPLRNGIVALAFGVVIGMGLAFLLEYVDDTIRSREDLARAVPGLPVLALVPRVRDSRHRPSPLAQRTLTKPQAAAAEAYTSLRTSLQFVGGTRVPRVIQVTSAKAGEGKTTVAANLAVALARGGQRVALVDCDLRRSRLRELFDLSSSGGFTSVFFHDQTLESAMQQAPGVDRLWILPAGPLPSNPAEVVSAKRTAEIFADLQTAYDVVLADSPPVLPVADPIALSAWVESTLLITRASVTTRRDLRRTVEMLEQAGVPMMGSVLNDVSVDVGYSYRYYYRDAVSTPAGRGDGTARLAPPESSQSPVGNGQDKRSGAADRPSRPAP